MCWNKSLGRCSWLSPSHSHAPSVFLCVCQAAMAPLRKSEFSSIVMRALFTGACVSLLNACIAGIVWGSNILGDWGFVGFKTWSSGEGDSEWDE